MHAQIRKSEILGIQWSCLNTAQLRALSVTEITKPAAKDGGGSDDRTGTPYDPRLGEQRNRIPCGTCGKLNVECSGHFGHIELPIPVYNLCFLDTTVKLLQSICISCSKPRMKPEFIKMHGFIAKTGVDRLKAIANKCGSLIKKCPWCSDMMVKIEAGNAKKGDSGVIYYSASYNGQTKREELKASKTLEVFSKISDEHLKLMGFNGNLLLHPKYTSRMYMTHEDQSHVHEFRPESMIFEVLLVLPPNARPWIVSEQEDNERKDDDLTDKYNSLLKAIIAWKNFDNGQSKSCSTRRGKIKTRVDVEGEIQDHIWTLINNKGGESKHSSGGRAHRSIVDRTKGKHGRIQSNVGGKRVDFCARTVIIGGGNRLKNDELGVPIDVAEKLTKPEFVIPSNIDHIRSMVEAGKINCVIRNGNKTHLSEFPDHGISYPIHVGDICERQLQDGDIVLLNRQPTLRIESMMAFRVKICEGDAFQLPLCFTKSFNAD